MRVRELVEIFVELALRQRDRPEALDRHVGKRKQVVEHDAEALAELALVVGLQRHLRRRQRWPKRIVNEIEREPRTVTPVTERVETLQTTDRAVIDAFAALLVDIVLQVAGHRRNDLDLIVREELA